MLVVLVLVVILASSLIPIMAAASDARRLREGARLVSAMFSDAQARAMASGRSVGVVIQRNPNNYAEAMDLFLAEVPPPYVGDTANEFATVVVTPGLNGAQGTATVSFPSTDIGWKSIKPGDLIRFNYRGQFYYVDYGDTTNPYITSGSNVPLTPTDPSPDTPLPPATPTGNSGAPFQVFRQPIRTADSPVQLADGAVIDLNFCGAYVKNGTNDSTPDCFGTVTFPTANSPTGGTITGGNPANGQPWTTPFNPPATAGAIPPPPIIITFNSTGALEFLYIQGQVVRPLWGVYLLVGRAEAIPPAGTAQLSGAYGTPAGTPNFASTDCRWVFVSRESGVATVAETASSNPTQPNAVTVSRRFVQAKQNMGGG